MQMLWTFPLQKAQWASNTSSDTDLYVCYPDTASLEKQFEKVRSSGCDVGQSAAAQASFTPSTSPTLSFSGDRPGGLCKHATANLRAKLKALNRAPGKIVFRHSQGLLPTTQSVVKARHDPFCISPFRTRTHALPVFMQVIFWFRLVTNTSNRSCDLAWWRGASRWRYNVEVAPAMTSQRSHTPFFTVCLIFPFKFPSRTFTIGFYEKKSYQSLSCVILECSFPSRSLFLLPFLWCFVASAGKL